jgi:hypothetical protein
VSEHRGHRITDKDESGGAAASSQQIFTRKSQILAKKIDASTGETSMFEEELNEIAEQLRVCSFLSEFMALFVLLRARKSRHFLSWMKS